MAVVADDLKQQWGGHIEPSVFSSLEHLDSQLTAWIRSAPDDISDEATKAFAYWRAFDWKVQQDAATASSSSVDGVGSVSFSEGQRSVFRERRDYWKNKYERLTDDTSDADEFAPVLSRR